MRIQTKICGLSTAPTLDAAVAGGASHVGFVFYSASPRNVTLADARSLSSRVPDHVARVGVFVDPDDALLDAAVEAGRLSVVQVHKAEPYRCREIAERMRCVGAGLWAAVPIRNPGDLEKARAYSDVEIDRILYDAKTPDDALLPGGMGLRFDWRMLSGFRHSKNWVLAGGLDAFNVGEAIHLTGATMVDVSSGVETAPGVKDVGKIAGFLRATATL
ncbi:MAG: phosphoribosylanthranilate isomerase [Pseudomonadota bacterium]